MSEEKKEKKEHKLFQGTPIPTPILALKLLVQWCCCSLRWSTMLSFDPKRYIEAAKKSTKLTDFGGEGGQLPASVLEAFKVLCKSLQTEANMNFLGKFIAGLQLQRLCIERLQCVDRYKKMEAHKEVLNKPLFILGLMRTGTTIYFHCMAKDPNHHSIATWETWLPSRDLDTKTLTEAEMKLRLTNYLMPEMDKIHPLKLMHPEECIILFDQSFKSLFFSMWNYVPSYHRYYSQADLTDAYEYYKRVVQLLQAKHNVEDKKKGIERKQLDEKRWVLKAPNHVGYIDTILKLFPDANIVWLHRDPIAAIPSCCSLFGHFRNCSVDEVDAKEIGDTCLSYWASLTELGMKSYEKNKDRILNLRFEDLVKDPVTTVKRTYEYFNIPTYTSELEASVKKHMAENKKDKHGSHSYSLEEFGLDTKKVKTAFNDYYKKFIDSDTVTNYENQLKFRREKEAEEEKEKEKERLTAKET